MGKIKSTLLGLLSGLVLLGATTMTQAFPTFYGKVWRGSYGNPATGAYVILKHPTLNDTVMVRVGSDGSWARAPPWNLNLNEIVSTKGIDTNGDSVKTTSRVTSISGSILVYDLFPAGHSILVEKATDSVDSTNAKCYVKGKQDTLIGRFDIDSGFWDISFNANNFPARSRPVNGDTIKVEAWEGSLQGSTSGIYGQYQFIDVDTLRSFNLYSGTPQETHLEGRVINNLRISPNPVTSNAYLQFNQNVDGALYNIAAQKVREIHGNRASLNGLAPGTYFFRPNEKENKPQSTKKIILVK